MTQILKVSGLSIRRGDTTIVDDLNWTIEEGEHWVILGANGSGKTSLLKALTGFLSPTSGEFAVLDQVYGESDWRDLRMKVGVVTSAFSASIPPAEVALETVMSGKYSQLDLWAPVTARDKVEARRLLKVVEATGIADRPWLYLSQGERQRVLIARALMARPQLMILDEPCAGLDPVAREKFLRLITSLAQPAQRKAHSVKALVLVTHHVEEITPAFTHALLLRAGRVIGAGPCSSILSSARLSEAFGAPLKLKRIAGRYALTVLPN